MVLNRYRERFSSLLDPFARILKRTSPNLLSVLSLLFAIGAFFALIFISEIEALLVSASCVILNGFFDALDGRVAKLSGRETLRGDLVDHVFDRLADFFILAGISLSGFADVRIGLLALGSVLIASYMGTQSQALGLKRDYSGILGRAERILLTIAFLLVAYAILSISPPNYTLAVGDLSFSILDLMLIIFLVLAVVTILQRFVRIWRALGSA